MCRIVIDVRGVCLGRTVGVEIANQLHSFEVVNVLEFDSDRKRMSVIAVDQETGKRTLYCKGADAIVELRLRGDTEYLAETNAHLETLGSEGLRTLMVATRELDDAYYAAWVKRYDEASRLLDGRKEAQDALADEIERDMVLLGKWRASV